MTNETNGPRTSEAPTEGVGSKACNPSPDAENQPASAQRAARPLDTTGNASPTKSSSPNSMAPPANGRGSISATDTPLTPESDAQSATRPPRSGPDPRTQEAPTPGLDQSLWRTGRTLGRTLYCNDRCVGIVDTPELAAELVRRAHPRGTFFTVGFESFFVREEDTEKAKRAFEHVRAEATELATRTDKAPPGPADTFANGWTKAIAAAAEEAERAVVEYSAIDEVDKTPEKDRIARRIRAMGAPTEARAIRVFSSYLEDLGDEPLCEDCEYTLNEIRDYVHELCELREVLAAVEPILASTNLAMPELRSAMHKAKAARARSKHEARVEDARMDYPLPAIYHALRVEYARVSGQPRSPARDAALFEVDFALRTIIEHNGGKAPVEPVTRTDSAMSKGEP